ncbi:hypothetical protein COCON_G00056280 [Conger conger]|uniref:Kelch-like protein 36 n=1 Tax=Conger conger TaxID=82655 RepID=A0A9Q1I594_CONCO|nr:hypothetical protein COCON_G00056280 [Conger conger]
MASNVASGKYSLYNEQFPKSLQQGFQELRESVCLCDIQLVAEDRRFWAHRSVLAAASPYFRVMFSSDMRERTMEAVELKAIPAIGLECALDFIYTSLLNADFDSMEDVLLASTHLQVADLTDCCARILKEWLRVDNVFEILSLSERYDLPALKSHCIAFISQNLRAVLRTRENSLLQIDWECFSGLLRRDDVNPLVSESDILELAINWLNHDREGREQWLEPLVREIRLAIARVGPAGDAYLRTLRRGDARFETDVSFHNWFKIRSTRKGVLATCGKTTGSLECGEIMVLTGKSMDSWDTISRRKGMYNHCTVVLDDFLYLIGGQNSWFSDNHEEEAVASVWRFDPRFHRWTKMADMNVRRRRFHCSVLGAGSMRWGRGEGGLLFSAERYSPAHNRWTHIRALPRPPVQPCVGPCTRTSSDVCVDPPGTSPPSRGFHRRCSQTLCSATAPDRVQHHIYVSGRHTMPGTSATPATSPQLRVPQHESPCNIYVIGGVVIGGGGGRGRSYSDLLVTECYSPRDDQWTELRPLPAGHSQHGATAVGQTIYILGGFSWTAEGFLSAVHLYDTQSDTWAVGPPLPRPLVGLSSATLTLPHRVCPAHDDDVAAQPVE